MVRLVQTKQEALVSGLLELVQKVKAGEIDSFVGLATGPKITSNLIHVLDGTRVVEVLGQIRLLESKFIGLIEESSD